MAANSVRLQRYSWYLYDFGNSAFTTLIVTLIYGNYFKNVVVLQPEAHGDFLWALSLTISNLTVALVSPFLGGMADGARWRKKFLIILSLVCIVFTGLLFFVTRGEVGWGMALFILANIGFGGALVFYNAFLPQMCSHEDMGRTSGYGFAVGYLGGLISILAVFHLVKGGFEAENLLALRFSFIVVAVFFLIFALPAWLFIKENRENRENGENGREDKKSVGSLSFAEGYRRVGDTVRHIRKYGELGKLLLAYLVYNDGIITVIGFSSIYAVSTLHFSLREVLVLFIVSQIPSLAGAIGFGHLFDRWGGKRTIALTLILWCGVVIAVSLVTSKSAFYLVAAVAGIALGSSQSASRSLVALFTPRERLAEFYGFFALCQKSSSVLGPLLFGVVSYATGNQRTAVMVIGVFFVAGLVLLLRIDEEKGRMAAQELL